MSAGKNRDFASLLDELIAASPADEAAGSRACISRSTISRLPMSCIPAASRSRPTRSPPSTGWPMLPLKRLPKPCSRRSPKPLVEELPSIEPEAISRELGLGRRRASPTNSARKRRAFAFNNHPDRVAPHLRQRAMVRMQVANMLIDEAKEGRRAR